MGIHEKFSQLSGVLVDQILCTDHQTGLDSHGGRNYYLCLSQLWKEDYGTLIIVGSKV